MTYVALLRGINVGGNRKVEMARLKLTFEKLGFTNVKTFINSGNVIFRTDASDEAELTKQIETAIEKDFGFAVNVLLRSLDEIAALVQAIPKNWVNDSVMKCDVMFLWQGLDSPKVLEQIPSKPELEDVRYFPGAVLWRVDRDKITRGRVLRIIGTDVYKQLTVRNANTVRKLYSLMQAADQA